ncbi:MAG: hypothetical protein D6723_04655 [Acidobacteria bacterium]|nr:MAG: hypothetical protein D6723_04655 [Acidobacteriota bacterium]
MGMSGVCSHGNAPSDDRATLYGVHCLSIRPRLLVPVDQGIADGSDEMLGSLFGKRMANSIKEQ